MVTEPKSSDLPDGAADPLRLAFAHFRAGRQAEAEAICRRILEPEPGHPGAMHLLAMLAHAQGRLGPALDWARRAVAATPRSAGHRNTLGIILGDLRQWDECFAAFGEAIRLSPGYFEAHRNLAVARSKVGELDAAVAPLERAAQLRPADPGIWTLLASLHHGRLDLPAAIACRRRALALRPGDAQAHSDLLVTLHYSPDHTPEQIFQEHLAWAAAHEAPILRRGASAGRPRGGATLAVAREGPAAAATPSPVTAPAPPPAARRRLEGRLRIGYLSGDFRQHPMPSFLFPVLRGHDRERVSVFCYSDVSRPDAVTAGVRALADVWRDISALDDDAAAEQVRLDGIDVLVDLAGHLENRRLLVFARRPAPVRVSYIGYPDTTGMRSMQYRITDALLDPPGPADSLHTEQLVRLPGCCWAYDPGDDPAPPDVGPLPAAATGRITFGAFNRLIKVTEATAQLWSRVLRQIPGSRLAVLDSTGAGEASLRRSLARLGLDSAEIVVYPRSGRPEYLARYGHVDIALDTFPYSGMTTTCDAAWMGVPTVTLAGETHVARTGVSLLSALGLSDLIAKTTDEYVSTAVSLSADLGRLSELRCGLRQRVLSSALSNGADLARRLEDVFQTLRGRESLPDS